MLSEDLATLNKVAQWVGERPALGFLLGSTERITAATFGGWHDDDGFEADYHDVG
jgi:hypothetical protein